MPLSPPALPANRAFLIQLRALLPETPLSWAGRVEHVVSGQVGHFHSLAELVAFMSQVLSDMPDEPDGARGGQKRPYPPAPDADRR